MDKVLSIDTDDIEKAIDTAKKYFEANKIYFKDWDNCTVAYSENKTIKKMGENYADEFFKQYNENEVLNEEYVRNYIFNAICDRTIAQYVIYEALLSLKEKYNLNLFNNLNI